MIIAVCFTWKRCSWCRCKFTDTNGFCGYCSETCKEQHEAGASMVVSINATGVYKCTL